MTRRIAHAAQIGAIVLALALVPAALAAKGGGGGKPEGGGSGSSNSSLSLVVLDSTDGLPHWSNHVTFKVSTTVTQPYVAVNCYQNGIWIFTDTKGFYSSYLWGQTYGLNSMSWTSGAADCTANLFTVSSNGKQTTIGTTSFHVYA